MCCSDITSHMDGLKWASLIIKLSVHVLWTRLQMHLLHNRRNPLTSYQLCYSEVQSLSAACRRQKYIWAWKYDNCFWERVRKSSTRGNICSKTRVHPTNKVQETARIVFFFEMLLQYSASHQTNKSTKEMWEHKGWCIKRQKSQCAERSEQTCRRLETCADYLIINNFISLISEAQSNTDVTEQSSPVNKERQGDTSSESN